MDALNPLEHLEWALSIPPAEDFQSLPVNLEAWLDRELALDGLSLAKARFESLQHWRDRKRVLDPLWARELALLPEHVQSVLGPKKNLLLLAEMLQAIQWPDQRLVVDLKQGFHSPQTAQRFAGQENLRTGLWGPPGFRASSLPDGDGVLTAWSLLDGGRSSSSFLSLLCCSVGWSLVVEW